MTGKTLPLRHGREFVLALAMFLLPTPGISGAESYAPGVTDTEIKIGQTMPYSGPNSAYGTIGDPKGFPWTVAWQLPYQIEANLYAKYLLENRPAARIAILYLNDDFGKDYLKGFKHGLGSKAATMIVAEVTYEIADPTVDSQIVSLKNSGADTFFSISGPKAQAQAIRKVYDIGWKPLFITPKIATSVGAVLKAAGLEKSVGIISLSSTKDPAEPRWKDDPGMKEWFAWMIAYYSQGDTSDDNNVYGYLYAQTLVHVLKQCGDDLSRENVLRQATNIKNLRLSLLLPGITLNTGPTDYFPVKQAQMMRFDGKEWVRFGPILGMQ